MTDFVWIPAGDHLRRRKYHCEWVLLRAVRQMRVVAALLLLLDSSHTLIGRSRPASGLLPKQQQAPVERMHEGHEVHAGHGQSRHDGGRLSQRGAPGPPDRPQDRVPGRALGRLPQGATCSGRQMDGTARP